MYDSEDIIRVQLEVIARRIDRHLDNRDQRLFVYACQHRAQLLRRLSALQDEAEQQAQPAI